MPMLEKKLLKVMTTKAIANSPYCSGPSNLARTTWIPNWRINCTAEPDAPQRTAEILRCDKFSVFDIEKTVFRAWRWRVDCSSAQWSAAQVTVCGPNRGQDGCHGERQFGLIPSHDSKPARSWKIAT
jgi:hypothetical protein